ncbi:MAG TPA: phosphotransferase [Candidatus Dormibacteraeota bacterium]|nr:phosphotransferase [Candidatus Dormibacteraeota bacterium]
MTAQAERMQAIRVAGGLDDLLAGATDVRPLFTGDGKSGSRMERLSIGGVSHVLKHLDLDESWLMRCSGDLGQRQLLLFGSGLLDALPRCIDHAVVAVAPERTATGRPGTALLMRDVGADLVPEGGTPIGAEQELRFLDAMAALHASYHGFEGNDLLMSLAMHYTFLSEATAAVEAARGGTDVVPPLIAAGWSRLDSLTPGVARLVRGLLDDPSALVLALERTPQTLVHGDWKLGNMGAGPDGRTILLDWDRVSRGPATLDLAWYLAINSDRLTRPREALIDHYRSRLEAHGVDTAGWFEAQLELALVGAFVQLGWEKLLGGNPVELGWWDARVGAAAALLGG